MAPRQRRATPLNDRTNISRGPSTIIHRYDPKRKIETVDLTGSDDENIASSPPPRKVHRSNILTAHYGQAERDRWLDEPEDEDGADELIALSRDAEAGGTGEGFELYGTLDTKVVGIRYYKGHATIGEHVLVRRESSNPYDSNAVRIDNIQREQIGHLPRTVAAKLAPYMDSGELIVEGVLASVKGEWDCAIDIRMFGTRDPVAQQQLKFRMQKNRLPVDGIQARERERKQMEKDAKQRELDAKRRRAADLKMVGSQMSFASGSSTQQLEYNSSQPEYAGRSSQDFGGSIPNLSDFTQESDRFNPRAMGQMIEKYGVGEDVLSQLPTVDAPKRLKTALLPYQGQALWWLLDRENSKLPSIGSTEVVQLWKRSPKIRGVFTNIATNFSTEVAPTLASGGILADDMGLGKTLEIIALIIADQEIESQKQHPERRKGPTLIIAPVGVMSNWTKQIEQHVQIDQSLRVLTYHGSKRNMDPAELNSYDVVITTYATVALEYLPTGSKTPAAIPREKGIFSFNWRRVVLDEGHIIKNPNTKGAEAATNIMAMSKWALTGTPIINSLKDLYSLVRFIGLTGGLERQDVFNSVLTRPLKAGHSDALHLLQALMGTLCLRRLKDMSFIDLKLPELSLYIHKIKFHPQEQEKYDALKAEAEGMLQTYQARKGRDDSNKAQQAYNNLLEILLRMRQVCNHWKLCGERVSNLMAQLESEKVVDLTPENILALQSMLQLSIESREDCPVCLEELTSHSPVITRCAHIFGSACIARVIEGQQKCPMCRAELPDETYLIKPAVNLGEAPSEDEMDTFDTDTTSSKIEFLLGILKASHVKSGTKTIIFSQWTSFLNIVQSALDTHGYRYARIDGSMSATRREVALQAFDHDPDCTIMLASLATCAVGLNLVAANQVVLMDSWWAPAIEDQAIDRVHRLGQKRTTTVHRLVMEDSVEERTLSIQDEKRKLMMAAFGEKSNKMTKGKNARLNDIIRLLGGGGAQPAPAQPAPVETTPAVPSEIGDEATEEMPQETLQEEQAPQGPRRSGRRARRARTVDPLAEE